MGRYCIICKTLFGCVKGGEKHVCSDCLDGDSCTIRHHFIMAQVTGGICEDCWQELYLAKKTMAC